MDMSAFPFPENVASLPTRLPSWPAASHTQPILSKAVVSGRWQNCLDTPDQASVPASVPSLSTDDEDSRRPSTSTSYSPLPVSPDDLQPVLADTTFQAYGLAYRTTLGFRTVPSGNKSISDYEDQYAHMPAILDHRMQAGKFAYPRYNVYPDVDNTDDANSSYQYPEAAMQGQVANKRQRMNSTNRNELQQLRIPPGYPGALMSSSQGLVPSVLVPLSGYRRLSSPVGSIRPAVDGDDTLDSDDEEDKMPIAPATHQPMASLPLKGDADDFDGQATDEEESLPGAESSLLRPNPESEQASSRCLQPLVSFPSPSSSIIPSDRSQPSMQNFENMTQQDKPRKQKVRFEADLYTPVWVKGSAATKEGFCDMCTPGKWLQLKNSAFW